MRRYLYLSTAVAGVMMTAGAGASFAQCVTTQNCAELGYTETSCPDGTGIKCPFGDTFACTGGSCANDCAELGFTYPCTGANESGSGKSCGGKYQSCTCTSPYTWSNGACSCPSTYKYTCTGTGYSGGSGTACGGKYTKCSCKSGYTWKNGTCQKQYPGCTIGALFYSDDTCSSNLVSGKTLLGVVIKEKTSSANGWIMTVNPVQTGIAWGGYGTDIPRLTNITSKSNLTDIQASCTNTDIITSYGNSSTYPAAWTAKNYSPSGTPSGKSWCLPSGGLLNNINKSTNFTKINTGITTAGGKKIGAGTSLPAELVWSSSEHDSGYAWRFGAVMNGSSFEMSSNEKYDTNSGFSVRPVLAF